MTTTLPAALEAVTLPLDSSLLDVANWRPVTGTVAVETLASIAATVDEPDYLVARASTLPDGRTRVLYYAYVKPVDFEGVGDHQGPYLMMLADLERGQYTWLRRTDVRLCDA